ncbi:MAG: serine protease, partial [Myxococcales bacterium]|nr:serine protease [Myxococcales bacterium]
MIGSIGVLVSAALLVGAPARKRTANPKDSVFIVRPHYHDSTREMFSGLSQTFATLAASAKDPEAIQGYRALSEMYAAHAKSPGHGTGWLVVDRNADFVVTNRHVAGEADYVTLETEGPSHRVIDNCKVIYVDPKYDLAVIEVRPDQIDASTAGFEIFEGAVTEGEDDVWALGFPGAAGVPHWQITNGKVNNAEFPLETEDGVQQVLQHSASIDPGNSGGPLVVRESNAALGYRVVGVNTWSLRGRNNVNLAIPAKPVVHALDEARKARLLKDDADQLVAELKKSAERLADELGSGHPDVNTLDNLISYGFVAARAKQLMPALLNSAGDMPQRERLQLYENPVESMRRALFVAFVTDFAPRKIADAKFVRLVQSDVAGIAGNGTVRSVYTISDNNREIQWVFEHGFWRIRDATFTDTKAAPAGTAPPAPQPAPAPKPPDTPSQRIPPGGGLAPARVASSSSGPHFGLE